MKRNYEPEAIEIIGLAGSANKACKELQAKYKGKTVTDLGAILANVIQLTFDDRKQTIEEKMEFYEGDSAHWISQKQHRINRVNFKLA